MAGLDLERLGAEARAFFDEAPRLFEALRRHRAKRFPRNDTRGMAYAIRMQLPLLRVATDATWGHPGGR